VRSHPPDRSAQPDGLYGGTLSRAVRRIAGLSERLGRERVAAASGLAHLAELPERERHRAILTEPRFRTWSVARQALDFSAESRIEDPGFSEELSVLALGIADTLSPCTYGRAALEDLRGEAWGAIGNARRIRAEWSGAADAFERARGHADAGTGDPLEAAELAALYATLLRDLRCYDEARLEYDTAIGFYHDLGERHLEGRTLISQALLERRLGGLEEAMHLLERALRRVDPQREPRLSAVVQQNRSLVLAEMDEPERALRVLDSGGAVTGPRGPGRLDRLRFLWLRGRLLKRLGRWAEARRAFVFTRAGFLRAGLPADAALVGLELARQALDEGDREETRRLASEAFPVLAARRFADDTVRALELFHAAGGV
jgi:tetratricopeptide (TPR) repeat protein